MNVLTLLCHRRRWSIVFEKLETTHLVCKEANGLDYQRARLQRGIIIVTKQWLEECALSCTNASHEDFHPPTSVPTSETPSAAASSPSSETPSPPAPPFPMTSAPPPFPAPPAAAACFAAGPRTDPPSPLDGGGDAQSMDIDSSAGADIT